MKNKEPRVTEILLWPCKLSSYCLIFKYNALLSVKFWETDLQSVIVDEGVDSELT